MQFDILGEITDVETFASGSGIAKLPGCGESTEGRWRKRKGIAQVRLCDGSTHLAEIHWYEAGGIGRKEFKIKNMFRES